MHQTSIPQFQMVYCGLYWPDVLDNGEQGKAWQATAAAATAVAAGEVLHAADCRCAGGAGGADSFT
jgi:hypothetical protein